VDEADGPAGSAAQARDAFLRAHPDFGAGGGVRDLRAREFARLDAAGHVYLDYTGAGL
jgi:hypothetical protein